MAGVKRRFHTDMDILALHKELDEVSCPICMDHPHNAVLILCSSHDKGCKPYICDTSYRHSNCLDRFKGQQRDSSSSSVALQSTSTTDSFNSISHADTSLTLRTFASNVDEHRNLSENSDVNFVEISEGPETSIRDPSRQLGIQGVGAVGPDSFHGTAGSEVTDADSVSGSSLKCPLCRGDVIGYKVVEEARKYLNFKKRSCSRESCAFSGNYQELRRHARRVHPATRPSDVDPNRERAWRCLERQREYDDIVTAIRSAIPGALVVGDYVIENGNRSSFERESRTGEVNVPFWTTFLLFQIGSVDNATGSRPRPRSWTRHHHSARRLPERRFLWGENLLGLQDDDNNQEVHIISDEDSSPIPRRRRRLNRSRSNDHQT